MKINYKSALGLGLIAYIYLAMGCVEIKPASLYVDENNSNQKEERNIKGFTALDIYHDDITAEIWGLEKTPLKDFEASTNIVYKGTKAIHVKWDKLSDNNAYVQLGFGWSGWEAKNIEDIYDHAAIQFYIRNAKDSAKVICVGLLEDYANGPAAPLVNGNMTDPKNYGGGLVTEKWKKVIVPLSDFNINKENFDLNTVKQLIFQFEVKGEIYIDEIEIVPYEKPKS